MCGAARSRTVFIRRMAPVRREIERLLLRSAENGNASLVAMCRKLHGHRDWLWTLREKLIKIGAKVARHPEVRDLSVGGGGGAKRVVCGDSGTDQAVGNATSIGRPNVCMARMKRNRAYETGEAALTYRPTPTCVPLAELWQTISRQTKMAAERRLRPRRARFRFSGHLQFTMCRALSGTVCGSPGQATARATRPARILLDLGAYPARPSGTV